MVLSALDGSTLTLNAANGNDNSVTISLAGSGYAVEITKPWYLWHSHLRFDDIVEPSIHPTDLPSELPVIRSDNHLTLLSYAFDVLTGNRYWDLLLSIPNRWEGNASYEVNHEQDWAYSESVCSNGGSATTQFTIYGWFVENSYSRFEDCIFDDTSNIAHTGETRGFSSLGGHGVDSDGLTLYRVPDIDLAFAGWIRNGTSITRLDNFRTRQTESLSLAIGNADGSQSTVMGEKTILAMAGYRQDINLSLQVALL